MMWYLQDVARFKSEKEALRELEREVAWMQISGWRIDPALRFCVDAEITVGSKIFALTLRYGQNFPFTAPSVIPQKPERWSQHQYGTGDLCLEYGPDNWRQELTGADMLRSAERLLSGETAAAEDPAMSLPSRHATTLGQNLRNSFARFLVTQSLASMLAAAPRGRTARTRFFELYRENNCVIVPAEICGFGDQPWTDEEVPNAISCFANTWNGLTFTLPSGIDLPILDSGSALKAYLSGHGFAPPPDYAPEAIELLLICADAGMRLFWIWRAKDTLCDVVLIPAGGGERLHVDHAALWAKTVGLVGCGSVGAKVATMLARAGVGSFVLVDDDLFLPENLVRQEFDWMSMGEHKVDALARHLKLVAPGVSCTMRHQRLGGQEANGVADWSLTLLRECDLIINATADAQAFNLIASVVHAAAKPLVWMEVFAGGIGGLIARSRPGLDPPPQAVRAHIEAWCDERGVAAPRPAGNYGAHGGDAPLIANDADVTVIAAHSARFSIDILIGRNPSWFPVSIYLVGLAPEWIFDQPFQTFPIDVGSPPPNLKSTTAADPADLEAIIQLIEERHDQSPDAS